MAIGKVSRFDTPSIKAVSDVLFSHDTDLGNPSTRHICRCAAISYHFRGFQHSAVVSRFHFLFYGSFSVSESDIYVCKLLFSAPGLRFGHNVKVICITFMASLTILACITAVFVDGVFRACSFNMGRSLLKG